MASWMTRTCHTLMLLSSLSVLPLACSSDEQDAPKEPVSPEVEATPYPEDPDMKDKPAEEKGDGSEPVGTLTDDPFAKQPEATDDGLAAAPGGATPPPTDDALQGAFEENQPNYQPAPSEGPKVPGKASGKGKKAAGASSGKVVTRYVTAFALNVRSKPSLKGSVVRRLSGGEMVQVELQGKFAKLGEGEFVRSKYLSAKPPKKFSKGASAGAKKAPKSKKAKAAKKAKSTPTPAPAAPEPAPADPVPMDEPTGGGDLDMGEP